MRKCSSALVSALVGAKFSYCLTIEFYILPVFIILIKGSRMY